MENINLMDTSDRATFFRQGILSNLEYWQHWIETKLDDIAALDQECSIMVRAISFGLDLGQSAWSSVYDLIKNLSPFMERRGHWSEWYQILSRAVNVTQHLRDSSGEVNLLIVLARLSFQQGHFGDTVRYYRRVIHLARHIGDRYNEARACSNLGYHFFEQGQWFRAEVLCCYALKIFEELDSNHGRAHTENHLGCLYGFQNRWDQATRHLERACTIWQTMGDAHGLMRGYINLGALYIRMENPDSALDNLEKALSLAKSIGDETTVGRIYADMGLASAKKDPLKAEAFVQQAEAIFKRFSNLAELAHVWNISGIIYSYQNEHPKAVSYFDDSLKTWRRLGNKIREAETLVDIVEYELTRGNRQQAAVWLQQAENLVGQYYRNKRYHHLFSRLTTFRNDLNGCRT